MGNLKQTYMLYVKIAQSRLTEISTNLNMRTDKNILAVASQLQEYLKYPISDETIRLLANTLQLLEQHMTFYQTRQTERSEGNQAGYMKVKKTASGYIPTDDVHDIEIPNYEVPILNSRITMRDSTDPFMQIGEANIYPSNRGSSNIFMLAFLSFLFETIFLILAFFLYQK